MSKKHFTFRAKLRLFCDAQSAYWTVLGPTDRESCDCKWCSRKCKLPGKVLRKLSLACHLLLKSLLDFDTEMPE